MRRYPRSILILAVVAVLGPAARAGTTYQQTNLVSDLPGAVFTDPNLKNPWGMAFSSTSPFWLSDQRTGVATLYNSPSGMPNSLVVTIPGGSPTGVVSNSINGVATGSFILPQNNTTANFIFATLGGTIAAWNPTLSPNTSAVTEVPASNSASYTGLALANNGTQFQLYAADNHNGAINVFGPNFAPTTAPGGFVDPNLPTGFVPYNIQLINGKLFVTYEGSGAAGLIDVFNTNGTLLQRFSSDSHLSDPWGMALAPSTFGDFANDLLVGNKADGHISAFDPTTGAFLGQLTGTNGQLITIPGLWGLGFRTAASGFDPNALYFNAGVNAQGGDIYTDGLFGSISVVPEPSSALLLGLGMTLIGAWRYRARRTRR
jgi:uncharacterized protein (TIGR03118 family)